MNTDQVLTFISGVGEANLAGHSQADAAEAAGLDEPPVG